MSQTEFENEVPINNEYDYSNIVAEVQSISYLVQYCEALYNQLLKLMSADEEKNAKLKYEFQHYDYKKTYDTQFEVTIKEKEKTSSIYCHSYQAFTDNVNKGCLKNVASFTIKLNLSYKRGKESSLSDYENEFKMIFQPYNIKFIRKSNHNETNMNQIENNINDILKKFKVQDSIFCTK